MTREKTPRHSRPTQTLPEPTGPEPTHAERARTIVHLGRVGTLSTVSRKHPAWPFGSVMPYGLDEQGGPTLLISTMAMHTQNLLGDDRASLLVTEAGAAKDPLGAGRVTLMGRVARVAGHDRETVRGDYLARYPNASYWVDFEDFAFFRMDVVDLYFVGGFGVMGWVGAEEYAQAQPDPLADEAHEILEHMNADHVEALLLLAKGRAGVEGQEARMTAVDRYGFHARVTTSQGLRGIRIPFDREVGSARQTRSMLVEMVRKERSQPR